MLDRILFVDDEPNVLAGYRRQLRKDFAVTTATSGVEGLRLLSEGPAFAVVVSDMRMPEMNGVEFLEQVHHIAPESVRMMLTGNADLSTCIDAVNEGNIFRFLTKTSSPEELTRALRACVEHHRLITVERELLQGTLSGSIELLTEVLGITNPVAFSRGSRIRRYVRHIAAQLNAPHFWEYDMAAALCQVGQVAMPPDVLSRLNSGRSLTSQQRGLLARHPAIGCELLRKIPRFERIAQMVARQHNTSRRSILPSSEMTDDDVISFGAQLLRFSLDFDSLLLNKLTPVEAMSQLHELYGADHPMVDALMSFEADNQNVVTMETKADELTCGMVAAEDIETTDGQVLLAAGQPLTEPAILHLQSCADAGGLKEPFRVGVSPEDTETCRALGGIR